MNDSTAMQKKPEKKKKSKSVKLKSEKVETMFQGDMLKRMRAYKQDHGFFKMQELVRVAVSYFLQKQGY